jgi:hypothetical protein
MVPRSRFTATIGVLSDAKVSSDKETGKPVLVIETDHAAIEFHVQGKASGADIGARFGRDLALAASDFEEFCTALAEHGAPPRAGREGSATS